MLSVGETLRIESLFSSVGVALSDLELRLLVFPLGDLAGDTDWSLPLMCPGNVPKVNSLADKPSDPVLPLLRDGDRDPRKRVDTKEELPLWLVYTGLLRLCWACLDLS